MMKYEHRRAAVGIAAAVLFVPGLCLLILGERCPIAAAAVRLALLAAAVPPDAWWFLAWAVVIVAASRTVLRLRRGRDDRSMRRKPVARHDGGTGRIDEIRRAIRQAESSPFRRERVKRLLHELAVQVADLERDNAAVAATPPLAQRFAGDAVLSNLLAPEGESTSGAPRFLRYLRDVWSRHRDGKRFLRDVEAVLDRLECLDRSRLGGKGGVDIGVHGYR